MSGIQDGNVALDADTHVYPGHRDDTTEGEERPNPDGWREPVWCLTNSGLTAITRASSTFGNQSLCAPVEITDTVPSPLLVT